MFITAKTSSYIINYGGKYSVSLKDSRGNAVLSKKVTFILNGKSIGSTNTDKNGVVAIQLTSKILKTAKSGKKNLEIRFNDDDYNSASKLLKFQSIGKKPNSLLNQNHSGNLKKLKNTV